MVMKSKAMKSKRRFVNSAVARVHGDTAVRSTSRTK